MRWMVMLLVVGCGTYYPHDSLVIIEISPALSAIEVDTGSDGIRQIGPMLADGIRWWDAAGAQLRTRAQTNQEAATPILRFVAADDPPIDAEEADAWYSPSDGEIHILLPPRWTGNADAWRSISAHEAGHAMGLGHLPPCATMSVGGCGVGLTPEDVDALHHL